MKKFTLFFWGILSLILCFSAFLPASASAQIVINEIMPANVSAFLDPTHNYGGWVEFFNAGNTTQSLQGYYVTDDPKKPKKYRIRDEKAVIPAKGFYVCWFGNHKLRNTQASFKLNCGAAQLFLNDTQGKTVASVNYPQQIANTSYARIADGENQWGVCLNPSPQKSNSRSTFASKQCPDPEFSMKGGVFTGAVDVDINCPAGMEIRYTTDGSEPHAKSPLWTEKKQFYKTTVLRARVMAKGFIPGNVMVQSYLISNHKSALPVLSIVTDPKNLWDDKMGIYTKGTNGVAGNGVNYPANWNRPWARPANIEYFEDSKLVFSQECDLAIGGGWSRAWKMKSLKLTMQNKYTGKKHFPHRFFKSKPDNQYKGIYLRNSGNDFFNTMMADAMQQSIVAGVLDVDYQAYQPVVHYINGEYYGIINIRERSNHHYIYSNYGYSKNEIDLIEQNPKGTKVLNGSMDAYNDLLKLSANAADPSVYKRVTEKVDIDEFIVYMVAEIYGGNNDWLVNNTKMFRHKNNGKWRWILYDMDDCFKSTSYNCFTNKIAHYTNLPTVRLFRNLIKNAEFKQRFTDYFTICLGSVYRPQRVHHIIDSIAGGIRAEIPLHQNRWSVTRDFENRVKGFKSFASRRPEPLLGHLRSFFKLEEPVRLSITSNTPGATLEMNDIKIPLGAMEGHTFKGNTVRLKAIAPPGYSFVRWTKTGVRESVVFEYGSIWEYFDNGSLDGEKWQHASYKTTEWKKGKTPLGYGNQHIKTTIDYGGDPKNKRPTAYMRHSFELDEWSESDEFRLHLTIDDGTVVYVNGEEVGRHLLPKGKNVTYDTFATSYAEGNPDKIKLTIPASALRKGKNLIAAEVHQNSRSSSDLYLDAKLVHRTERAEYFTQKEITLRAQGALQVQAEFKK